MKNLVLTGTAIAATILFSACDPQARPTKPARGPGESTETEKPKEKPKQEKPKPKPKKPDAQIESTESTPSAGPGPSATTESKPETKPAPTVNNPEYGKKTDGKPGFIESPYSAGKLIDVRGLPPGTEIECPYTRKALLVP